MEVDRIIKKTSKNHFIKWFFRMDDIWYWVWCNKGRVTSVWKRHMVDGINVNTRFVDLPGEIKTHVDKDLWELGVPNLMRDTPIGGYRDKTTA